MASSTTIDVDDFGSNIKEEEMESLDFQDIPHGIPDSPEKGQTTHFTRFPHSAADSDDEADDKEKLIKEEKTGTSSFWTFAYYQQFFDVETAQVGQRIVGSMLPRPGSNYLMHQIRPNPDLYGPFWICTTLVFTTAIAGNLANYFSMAGKAYHWQYDFHKVTFAATAIFSYWWLIPLILWAVLWWRGSQAKFSFLEMLCVYGYSLAIYVPISILWAIQVSWLQWTLVVVGAALSGSVLLLTFWPAIKEDSQKIAIGLMVFIFIMHAALAAGFVLYFFHVPASASAGTPVTPLPVPVNKTAGAKILPPSSVAASKGQVPVKGNLNGGGLSGISDKNQLARQPLQKGVAGPSQAGAQTPSGGAANVAASAAFDNAKTGNAAGQGPIQARAPEQGLDVPAGRTVLQGTSSNQQRQVGGNNPTQQIQSQEKLQPSGKVGQGDPSAVAPQGNREQAVPRNPQQPAAPQKRRSLAGSKKNRKRSSERA